MLHHLYLLLALLFSRADAATYCSAAIQLDGATLHLRPVTDVSSNGLDHPLYEVADSQASTFTLLPDNLETIRAYRTYRYDPSGTIVVDTASFRVTTDPPATCSSTTPASGTATFVTTPVISIQDGVEQHPTIALAQGSEPNDNIPSRTFDTSHQPGPLQSSLALPSPTDVSASLSGTKISRLSQNSAFGTTSPMNDFSSTAVFSTTASSLMVTESAQPSAISISASTSHGSPLTSSEANKETGMSSTRVVSESATSADTDTGLSAPTRSPKTSTSVWGFDLGRPIASMIGITSQRMSTITSTSEASSSPSSTTLSSTTTFDVSASDLASSMTASRPVPIDSSGITWMPTSSGFLTTTSPSSAMAESSPSILPDSTNTSRSTLTSSFFRVSESKTSTDVQSTTQTTGTQKFDSTTWIISTSNALSTASGSGQITQTEVEASSDSDSVTITRSIERTRASQSSGDPDPSGTTVDIGLGPTTAIPDITPTVVPDRPSTIPTPAPPPTASNPGPPPTAVIPGPPPVISSPPSPSRVQSTTLVITSATGCELRTGSMCTQLCSFATDGAGGTTSSSCARASCLPSIGCSATIATITRTTDPACSLLPEPEGLFATDGDGPLPTLLHTAQVVIRAPGEPSTSTTTSIGFTLISTVPAPQPTASLSPSQKFIYIDNIKNCTTSGAEPRCDYFWSAMERTPGMRGGQESDRCTDRSIWYGNSSSTVPNYPIDVGPFDLPSYKSCSLRKESESDGGTILCGSTATTCNYVRGNAKLDCGISSQELSGNSVCIFVGL